MKYLFLFILFSGFLFSGIVKINFGNKNLNITTSQFHNIDYLSSGLVNKHLLPTTKFNKVKREFVAPDFTITYEPGGFYITKEDWNSKTVYQLQQPISFIKGVDYFPIFSFVETLDSMQIYDVTIYDRNIALIYKGLALLKPLKLNSSQKTLVRYDNEGMPVYYNLATTQSAPFSKAFMNNIELLNSLIVSDAMKQINEPEIKMSNRKSLLQDPIESEKEEIEYKLPPKLIRKELEEIRSKK